MLTVHVLHLSLKLYCASHWPENIVLFLPTTCMGIDQITYGHNGLVWLHLVLHHLTKLAKLINKNIFARQALSGGFKRVHHRLLPLRRRVFHLIFSIIVTLVIQLIPICIL